MAHHGPHPMGGCVFMLIARAPLGVAQIHTAPDDNSAVMRILASGEELAITTADRSGAAQWLKVEFQTGRLGWVHESQGLELRRDVFVDQAEALLVAQPGDHSAVLRKLKRRARVALLRTREEAGERWVLVRLPSGKEGYLPGSTRVTDTDEVIAAPDGSLGGARKLHSFHLERWFIRRGVV